MFCGIIFIVEIRSFLYKAFVFCALVLCACDLQPKIASIPDSVGMFIEDRYPALLADPETQPEIYNSAVTDYGVYASPELYGSSNIDDYVLYASVDDYVLLPEEDTVETVDKEEDMDEPEIVEQEEKSQTQIEQETEEKIQEDYLIVPVYGGNTVIDKVEDIKVPEKKSDDIVVAKGDTVYSLARKNNMTVDEFAKINNLREPYTLRIGQKLTTKAAAVKPEEKTTKEIPNIISQEKVKEIKAAAVAKAENKPEIKTVKKTEEKKVETTVKEDVKPTNTKRVNVQEITIEKGDTLYSLSRKYEIPVNDLAIMNKLSAPFNLSVGQKIKVPKLTSVPTRSATEIKTKTEIKNDTIKPVEKQTGKNAPEKKEVKKVADKSVQQKQSHTKAKQPETKNTKKAESKPKESVKKTQTSTKISSNPKQELPKITPRSSSKFSWPVRGKILSGFGPKNGGLVNDGINIAANAGTLVRAAENGVVAYAGNEVRGMGNLIIMQHSDGWMTVYAHLSSMTVKRGDKINVGQQIGKIGQTGKVDRPQLHFEIRKGTKAYNPTLYLKK